MAPTPQDTHTSNIHLISSEIRIDYEHEAPYFHQRDLVSITHQHSNLDFSLAMPTRFQNISKLDIEFPSQIGAHFNCRDSTHSHKERERNWGKGLRKVVLNGVRKKNAGKKNAIRLSAGLAVEQERG
jgi:hypothetical protein